MESEAAELEIEVRSEPSRSGRHCIYENAILILKWRKLRSPQRAELRAEKRERVCGSVCSRLKIVCPRLRYFSQNLGVLGFANFGF